MNKSKHKASSLVRPIRRWAMAGATSAAAIALVTGGLAFAGTADAPTTLPAVSPLATPVPQALPATRPVVERFTITSPLAATATTRPSVTRLLAATTRPAVATPSPAVSSVRWEPAATPAAATVAAAPAPQSLVRSGQTSAGKITLDMNRTAELRTSASIKRVSVGQPEIADVQPFASDILLVTAKKPGVTQVIIWDDQDRSESLDVNVEIPLDQLRELIAKVAPDSNIEVAVAADQIVLRGQATNLTVAKQIGDVAGAYGRVQNMIEVAGAQTVAVQVQFAEVSRNVTNSLGINWGFHDGTSIFGSQPGGNGPLDWGTNDDGYIDRLAYKAPGAADFFGRGTIGGGAFGYFVKALRDNSLLRILQEPTISTTSGEPANFIAGGQVAVPVPADNGSIGIEYKEYGVRLLVTPIVLGNGKIKLVMEAESSELDYANGTTISGAAVPGLRTRRVKNTVELGEGQTMSVAGLLDDSVIATRQSVPGLGDIPVLGQLFRSTRYQRKETELVVLITPRISGALNPGQVPPLPGASWRHPSELEQFAFGDMGGNREADAVQDWNKPNAERGVNPPPAEGGLNASGRIASSRQGRDPNQPPPTFIGDHGYAPAQPRRDQAIATVRD